MGKAERYRNIDMLGYKIFASDMNSCLEKVFSMKKVHIVSGNPEVLYVGLNNKELFINSDMYQNIPTMMMPIVVKEEVIGFVALSNVKFEELTLHNETLFKITTKLVTGALSRAYKYEKAIINEKYIKDTEMLTPEYFRKVIAEKNNIGNKEENVLIKVESSDYNKIKNCVRSIDYIGINDKEEVFIFVTNTKQKESTLIIDRLEKNNLEAKTISFSELKIYGLEEQKKLEKVG